MGNTANEDKRAYMSRRATIDELQPKVSALLNIEKVPKSLLEIYMCFKPSCQDFRASVGQLQTLEKEMHALQVTEKRLTDSRDSLEEQMNERKGSSLKVEVRIARSISYSSH